MWGRKNALHGLGKSERWTANIEGRVKKLNAVIN